MIVKRYLSLWDKSEVKFPLNEKILLKQIKLTKIWSGVEFLSNSSEAIEPDMFNQISDELIRKAYEFFNE